MSEIVVKKNGRVLAIFALLVALISIGFTGYIYYTNMLYKRNLNAQLDQISVEITHQSMVNANSIKSLQDKLNELEIKIGEVANNRNDNILFQINELISLANQGLVVYDDISGALRLLAYAKEMLDSNNDVMFTGLKYALAQDITKLKQLTNVDKVSLSGELDSIASAVTNLNIAAKINRVPGEKNQTQNKWNMFVNNLKSSLASLVSITKPDNGSNVLLPQQNSVIQEGIRVDLLNARMALLQHDQASWTYSLNNAKVILDSNFTGYLGIEKLDAQLIELLNVNVANPNANIDATITQLIKLNNLK